MLITITYIIAATAGSITFQLAPLAITAVVDLLLGFRLIGLWAMGGNALDADDLE